MKLPFWHHPIFRWLAALSLVYLLLLGIGIYRGGAPARDIYSEIAPNMPSYDYAVSRQMHHDARGGELDLWLSSQEIPHPPNSDAQASRYNRVWHITNTAENHALLQAWMDDTYGPGSWRHTSTEAIKLDFRLAGREFGLSGLSTILPNSEPEKDAPEFQPARPFTALLYGYNGQTGAQKAIGPIYFSSQFAYYEGPTWPALVLFVLAPGMFLYLLRRPLSRAMRLSRPDRTSQPTSEPSQP